MQFGETPLKIADSPPGSQKPKRQDRPLGERGQLHATRVHSWSITTTAGAARPAQGASCLAILGLFLVAPFPFTAKLFQPATGLRNCGLGNFVTIWIASKTYAMTIEFGVCHGFL